MNEHDEQSNLGQNLVHTIKEDHVSMRPKWHYAVGTVVSIVSGVLLAALLLYVASFVVFELRENGSWFGPAFGTRGWLILISSLPWLLLLVILILIVGLERLMRRYALIYRRPLIYSLLGIVIIVAVGGIL